MDIHKIKRTVHRLSAPGLLVTLGIIFGDIGTSPLYVMSAIIGTKHIDEQLIFGSLSCIFWTLTLQTTFKYVVLTLRADNNGEGGIFALFAQVRRRSPYLIIPAIIGGSALLADGIITPPISVSAAIEGLRIFNPDIPTIPIVITIITLIFLIQRFGTNFMGNAFGPIMGLWFLLIGSVGTYQLIGHWEVFKAINPYYAYSLLAKYPNGFWLLGSVFLCTTGAEALYSDLGHCGRPNIRISWIFVKICLLLNYFGQGVWLLQQDLLNGRIPFYEVIPREFLLVGIIIATAATIIASQAMISGSFSLISEAIRLNIWPKVKINYPTIMKGQLYVPSINWFLWIGCIFVLLHFKESRFMEAAYGLAINLTFLMSTFLLCHYMYYNKKLSFIWIVILFIVYFIIESAFLIANLSKFTHGGYVTMIISGMVMIIMYIWYTSRKIKNRLTEFVKLEDYFPLLKELSHDMSVSKYATHLVYLTGADNPKEIESKVVYSIFQKQPKRADVYWFIHIDVLDEPYTMEYKVDILVPDDVVRVEFKLGFRIEQRVNLFFRKVVEDMVANKEIDFTSRYTSLKERNVIGDFRFVVLEKHLSHDNDLPPEEQLIMDGYFFLKNYSLSEASAFGLDTSSVTVEKVPMVISPTQKVNLTRIT